MKKKFIIIIVLIVTTLYVASTFKRDISKEGATERFSFVGVETAKNEHEKTIMRVSKSLNVVDDKGVSKSFPLTYKTILHGGEKINNQVFAQIIDKDGNPILMADGSSFISNNPDANSILKIKDKNYLITNFEEQPGELYKTELSVKNNLIIPKSTTPIDFKEIGGTITNCAGSRTSWNTHLGGEEDYNLNTRYADKASPYYIECERDNKNLYNGNNILGIANNFCASVAGMQKYLKDTQINDNGYNGEFFTPYNYGYIIEVEMKDDGTSKSAKHYVTGKYTPELAVNMPDKKTFYMSDDGNAKGLYKFVSDKPIDKFKENWSGTLYAAKLKQITAVNAGSFKVTWVKLGKSSDNELQKLIAKKLKISDIFDIKQSQNRLCKSSYTKVYEDGAIECLKLKLDSQRSKYFEDNEAVKTAAAFLETRKYSAYLGATIELNKEEGLTYDKDKNILYLAMTQIANSMENNYDNNETTNDVRLDKNICGAVYALSLDKKYNVHAMNPLLVGKPLSADSKYADEYACYPDKIANPDNILYLGSNSLLVGEDTTSHVNNFLWIYNTISKKTTRIASLPIGAEVTGLALANIDNKKAIMLNIQHPFKDNPKNVKGENPNSYILQKAKADDMKASIGYIDGLPSNIFK